MEIKLLSGLPQLFFSGENFKADKKPGFHPHSGSEGAVVMFFYFWKANQTTELKVTQWVPIMLFPRRTTLWGFDATPVGFGANKSLEHNVALKECLLSKPKCSNSSN